MIKDTWHNFRLAKYCQLTQLLQELEDAFKKADSFGKTSKKADSFGKTFKKADSFGKTFKKADSFSKTFKKADFLL